MNKHQGNQIAQTELAIVTSPTEIAEFTQLIDEYYAAWSWQGSVPKANDFDGAGQFYAKEPDLIF